MILRPATHLPALCGYALLFNVPSHRRANDRRMQFTQYAFDRFLATSTRDVFACIDHEGESVKFASWFRHTLLIDADAHGLFVIALPRNDSYGRISVELVLGGHVAAMSAKVRYDVASVTPLGHTDIVNVSALDEVSGVERPAIPGTVMRVVDRGLDVPQTVAQLHVEEMRLRTENLRHWKAGTRMEWKREKAGQRAALLESLATEPLAAAAG
jgi:phage head maturation protease